MQKQSVLNKQKLDQAYSFGVMGNLFSALEWYAYRIYGEKIKPNDLRFNHYNNFNSGNKKDLDQLKNQIITQIEIFKFSYLIYKKDHKKYNFPENLSEKDIIKEIEKWKNLIKNKSPDNLKYYDAIINIIQGNDISFVDEIKKEVIEKGEDPNKIDPNFIMGPAAAILSHTDSLANDKNFIENGNKMDLDEPNPGNEKLQKIGEDEKEKLKKSKELDDLIEETLFDLERIFILDKKKEAKNITLKYYKKDKPTSKLEEAIQYVKEDFEKFNEKKEEYGKYNLKYYYKNEKERNTIESHLKKLKENIKTKKSLQLFKNMEEILNEMNNSSFK